MRQVTQCPVCDSALKVTELSCTACETRLHGSFPPPPLARLSPDHQKFVETFLRCRGIIRDVERVLGISYPTVRARLDSVIGALEFEGDSESAHVPDRSPAATSAAADRRRELLRRVEAGELDPGEAARALRRLKR